MMRYDLDEIAIPTTYSDRDGYILMTIGECIDVSKKICAIRDIYGRPKQPAPEQFTQGYVIYRLPRIRSKDEPSRLVTPSEMDRAAKEASRGHIQSESSGDQTLRCPLSEEVPESDSRVNETKKLPVAPAASTVPDFILINGVPDKIPNRPRKLPQGDELDQKSWSEFETISLTDQRVWHLDYGNGRIVMPDDQASTSILPGSVIDAADVRKESIQIIRPIVQGDLFGK